MKIKDIENEIEKYEKINAQLRRHIEELTNAEKMFAERMSVGKKRLLMYHTVPLNFADTVFFDSRYKRKLIKQNSICLLFTSSMILGRDYHIALYCISANQTGNNKYTFELIDPYGKLVTDEFEMTADEAAAIHEHMAYCTIKRISTSDTRGSVIKVISIVPKDYGIYGHDNCTMIAALRKAAQEDTNKVYTPALEPPLVQDHVSEVKSEDGTMKYVDRTNRAISDQEIEFFVLDYVMQNYNRRLNITEAQMAIEDIASYVEYSNIENPDHPFIDAKDAFLSSLGDAGHLINETRATNLGTQDYIFHRASIKDSAYSKFIHTNGLAYFDVKRVSPSECRILVTSHKEAFLPDEKMYSDEALDGQDIVASMFHLNATSDKESLTSEDNLENGRYLPFRRYPYKMITISYDAEKGVLLYSESKQFFYNTRAYIGSEAFLLEETDTEEARWYSARLRRSREDEHKQWFTTHAGSESCPDGADPRTWFIYQKMMAELYFDCFNKLSPDTEEELKDYQKRFLKHRNEEPFKQYVDYEDWYKSTLPNQEMYRVIGYESAMSISEIVDPGMIHGLFGSAPNRVMFWRGKDFFEQERRKRGLSSFADFKQWFEEERARQHRQEMEFASLDNQYGLIDYVPVVAMANIV